MRHELELMELVDRYLRNELNAQERAAFTERLRTNEELGQRVEDQRALHAGMERLVSRSAVDKAYRSHRFGKWIPGIGGAVLIALLATGYFLMPSTEHEHSNVAPAKVSADTSNVITDPVSRNVRTDTLQQTRDTIIRTEVRVVRRPIIVHETTSISEKEPDPGIVTLRDARSEELPSYPGGFSAMHAFLQRNIQYPDTVLPGGGTVTIEFLVEVDGSIQEVQVAKGISKLFDQEALRVVGLMPKWNPAKENGKPVKARIEVPIRFTAFSVEQVTPSAPVEAKDPQKSDPQGSLQ